MPRRETTSGFTLVELALAALVLVAVMSLPAMLLTSSWQTYRTDTAASSLDQGVRGALDAMAGHLSQSSSAMAGPAVAAPLSSPIATFRRATGYAGGAAQWGPPETIGFEYTAADPNDGVDNDGDGLVDEGRAVWTVDPGAVGERRTVLSNDVAEWMEGEIPGNLLDDNGNGLVDERGLAFSFEGERIVIRMTVERAEPAGGARRRTVAREVTFRNRGP